MSNICRRFNLLGTTTALSILCTSALAENNDLCLGLNNDLRIQCLEDLQTYGGRPTGKIRASCIEIDTIDANTGETVRRWVCLADSINDSTVSPSISFPMS